MKKMSRWKQGDPAVLLAVAIVVMAAGLSGAGPRNFKPDGTFTGSALTGWRTLGDAEWKAQNGEIVGTAKPGTAGGWLVMEKTFQDVRLFGNYRCTGECRSGVLLRAQRTPDGGMRGVYISLTEGELGSYSVTLDAQGREVAKERLAPPAGRGGGGGAGRGTAPPATQPGTTAAPPAAGQPAPAPQTGARGDGPGQGRGGGVVVVAGVLRLSKPETGTRSRSFWRSRPFAPRLAAMPR